MEQTPIRPARHTVRVLATSAVNPSMRRVTLHAPTLTALPLRPAQDVGLVLSDGDGREVRRRYTIRNVDAGPATIDLDAILHGHGPGATWFANAVTGDTVEVVGPRGQIEIGPADWYLLIGDESGLPAFAEIAACLPAAAPVIAIVEADDEYPWPADRAAPTWVRRGGDPAGGSDRLAAALGAAELPAGAGRAYLLGESRSVVALRPALAERGLAGPQVFLKGYWNRRGRSVPA